MGYGDQEDSRKKKIAVLGFSSILLVAACVGAVTFGFSQQNSGKNSGNEATAAPTQTSVSSKAAQSICRHVDYKETCEESLKNANSSDPKELVKAAFQVTVKNIGQVIENSSLLKEAANDARTADALTLCKYLLNVSIDDFQRSFDKVETFDMSKVDEYVADLKTWLSGAITYQETCLDAFQNTSGDTGEKMKKLMTTATQLTSNGLAMVTQFSDIAKTLEIPRLGRKLMQSEIPDFVTPTQRRLLQAAVNVASLKPNATIAKDGSGTHKTISEAIATIKKNNTDPFVILIKAGVYNEHIMIPRKVNHVYIFGEGVEKTKITGSKNYIDGISTFHTATVVVNGDGCVLKDLTIENSAGPEKHQAVALRVSGDKAVIYKCRLDGYQDTLYSHSYRQYYRDTTITGTIDFIFGDAAAVFQNCTMQVRAPLENQNCMVTAQGRNNSRSVGGIVLQNCNIVADPKFLAMEPVPMAYLGRPWKEYSRTIIMQSNIDGFIAPEGWSPWMGTFGLDTLYYGEFQNRGPGSNMAQRVTWKGIQKMTPQIASSFTPGVFFNGDEWIKATGLPYEPAMFKL